MPYRGPVTFTTERLYREKVRRRKDEIYKYRVSNVTPVTDIVLRETPEFELYPQAVNASGYEPAKVGQEWGGGVNGWFKIKFTLPESFAGREAALFIEIGGEGCAYIDGKPFQGVDYNHQEVLLSTSAKAGKSYEIVIDAASIHWHSPHEKIKRKFSRCELGTRNPEVEEYWFNLETLLMLAEQLPEDSPRRAKIVYALNKSVDAFDYTNKDDESLKSAALRANEFLKPVLDKPANASATTVAVHGHSHIDVAWLWPYRETKRKCSRTFSTVMRMMEQYPDYLFTQSQAQLYEFTKQQYPELYEEIKQRIKEGRWDVEGSMWVEADCNLSSGESLVRQVLVGKNYFMDEFGIETNVLWLPDVFGYAAALPQILQKARIPYFSTIKINWSQFNQFPYNTFRWQGIDGTSVLAHFPPTTDYNAYVEPAKLFQQVSEFKEKDRCDESLLSYGWGDGGGGADRRHMEFLKRYKDLEGMPRCQHKKVSEFFASIDDPSIDYPEWVGELYLELHRGTYTSQAKNKKYNRQCEFLYRSAELLSSIASQYGFAYPYAELHEKWRDILLNQFHDVIPGSSIRSVYEDTDEMYPEIVEVGQKVEDAALSVIAESIDTSSAGQKALVVFNTLPWDRTAPVEVDVDLTKESVKASDGSDVAVQPINGKSYAVASAPSMGYQTYSVVAGASPKSNSSLKVNKTLLENDLYAVKLNESGVIASILHKATGRELLQPGQMGNMLRLYEDKPIDWQAWDIDFFYEDKWEDVDQADSIEVVEEGPISAAIQISRTFSNSKLVQTIRLFNDIPRIDFETWVDWHEDNKCLKACFPVDVNTAKARYEIQFGNVERPTHSNTSWDKARFEVAAHKWADISEQGFGMSLMNDCKYGHHTTGSEMRLTLLRAPKDPDPMADMGEHTFTYSIMPHAGDYIEAGTVREAYNLNVPMLSKTVASSAGELPSTQSFFDVDGENVILETVKKHERNETTILRLYECYNQRGSVTISTPLKIKQVFETDLMEDNIAEVEVVDGKFTFDVKPFEIKTFKLVF